MSRHVVARLNEIAPGKSKAMHVEGRDIAIFNVDGEYFAFLNRCPHEGAELAFGKLTSLVESDRPGCYAVSRKNEILRCPWHGWEFDLRTGQSYCDPQRTRVRTYDVAVAPGEELVKGPYVAETFPVSIEEDYLVIDFGRSRSAA